MTWSRTTKTSLVSNNNKVQMGTNINMKEYSRQAYYLCWKAKAKKKHFVVEVPMGRALGGRFYVRERERERERGVLNLHWSLIGD